MNLPSSLALSPSKLLQSRLGILLLALGVVAVGGGVFVLTQRPAKPPVTPSPATSPAAQALPRAGAIPAAPARTVYGPPAPEYMLRPAPVGLSSGKIVVGPPAPEHMLRPAPAATTGAPLASAATKPGVVYPPALAAPGATAQPAAGVTPAPAAVPGAARPATTAATATSPGTAAVPLSPSTAKAAAVEAPKSLEAGVLFAREQYAYSSAGRRDPFQSLIDGKFQGQASDAGLVDVGDIHLVGIMWGSSDKFALVEDSRGHGYVLRVGDPVLNGYISGISKTELQIVQNAFGDSQTLSIHLQPKEGDKNANRN